MARHEIPGQMTFGDIMNAFEKTPAIMRDTPVDTDVPPFEVIQFRRNYEHLDPESSLAEIGIGLVAVGQNAEIAVKEADRNGNRTNLESAVDVQKDAQIKLVLFNSMYLGILYGVDGQSLATTYRQRLSDAAQSECARLGRICDGADANDSDDENGLIGPEEARIHIKFITDLYAVYLQEEDRHFIDMR